MDVVSAQIINAYMTMINESERKPDAPSVFAFDTFFMVKLQSVLQRADADKQLERLQTWETKVCDLPCLQSFSSSVSWKFLSLCLCSEVIYSFFFALQLTRLQASDNATLADVALIPAHRGNHWGMLVGMVEGPKTYSVWWQSKLGIWRGNVSVGKICFEEDWYCKLEQGCIEGMCGH